MITTTDRVFQSFIEKQQPAAAALAAKSDIFRIMPDPDCDPPHRWIVEYNARGLVKDDRNEVVEADGFLVGIWFPHDYARVIRPGEVVTYLGPHRRPWHPNIRPPYVCLRIAPGTPLVDLIYWCYELWTWSLKKTADNGLNHEASSWARHQDPSRFPIDPRPLLWKEQNDH